MSQCISLGARSPGSELNSSVKSGHFLEGTALKGADIIKPGWLSVEMPFLVMNVNSSVQWVHFCEMTQFLLMIFGALKDIINTT